MGCGKQNTGLRQKVKYATKQISAKHNQQKNSIKVIHLLIDSFITPSI